MATYNKKPAADGNYEEWNGLAVPAEAYTAVDDSTSDTGHDGDSTYINDSDCSGHKFSFTLESWSVPEDEQISDVTVHAVVRMGAGTSGGFRMFCRLSSTDSFSSQQSLSGTYAAFSESISCPSGAWSDLSSLSGLEIGVEATTATGKLVNMRCTQIFAEITTEATGPTTGTTRLSHIVEFKDTDVARLASDIVGEKFTNTRLAMVAQTIDEGYINRLSNTMAFEAFDPDWWDTDYYRRAKINHGTTHSEYPEGYTESFALQTGYAEKIASNVLVNECFPWIGKDDDGNTYVAWLGYPTGVAGTCHIWIKKYTYSTSTWSAAVDVADSGSAYDTHYIPVGLIDNSGYIHLFYGCHNTQMKYIRSTNAKDISTWNSEGTIGTAGSGSTYPRPVVNSDGDIYVFCREYQEPDSKYVYYKSTNNGTSWGSMVTIVDYSTNYGGNSSVYSMGVRCDSSDRIHIGLTFHDWYLADNKSRAVAYIYANKDDSYDRWYEAGGSYLVRISTEHPVYYSDVTPIATSPNFPSAGPYYGSNVEGLCIDDATQYPYILYFSGVANGHTGDPMFARWTGSEWSITDLSNESGAPTALSTRFIQAMYIQNQTIYIYGQVLPSGSEESFGGELFRWRGTSYGTSWTLDYYTMSSGYGWGGVMGLYENPPDSHFREIAWGRGEDLYWMEDRQYTMVRNDGADVRVVLHQQGKADVELDRLPDQFQTDESNIYYKIDLPVPENREFPHAYGAYFVYWSKYNASDPPRDPNDVYVFYDSFETPDSGDDVTDSADWSGDTGAFDVCSAYDTTTHAAAHTNKIWSGQNFVFAVDDGTKAISHTISLDSHYIEFHICTGTDLDDGDKGYIELYDGNNSKYFRAGINYDNFGYLKSGGSWVDDSQGADSQRYHTIKLLINSSGVSFWGDGVSIVTNDNHITSCTAIKIGYDIATNSDDMLYYFDDVKIYKAVTTPGTTSLNTAEGTLNTGTARLANLPHLQKTATASIAHGLELARERTQRLSHLLENEKHSIARLAAIANTDKTEAARESHLIISEATSTTRIVNAIAGDKILTSRVNNTLEKNKTDIERLAHDADLDKETVVRLMNTAVMEKADIYRIANDLDLQYIDVIRCAHGFAANKELTSRLANNAEVLPLGIVRLSNELGLDKETIAREAHGVTPDKETVERLAHWLEREKTFTASIAGALDLEAHRTTEIAQTILTDKNLAVRVSNELTGYKTITQRVANLIPLDAEITERLACYCDLEAWGFYRLSGLLNLNKHEDERLANAIDFAGEHELRLAQTLTGSKITTIRIPGYIPLDKLVYTRVANNFEGNKELISRLSNLLSTEATRTSRLTHTLSIDKTAFERVCNSMAATKTLTLSIAHVVNFLKTTSSRVTNLVSFYVREIYGMQLADLTLATFNISESMKTYSFNDPALSTFDIDSPAIT